MNPLWTLAPLSVAAGALTMWVFRRTADQDGLREAVNHIQAHLLEFWLFVDEPAVVWKSWGGLLRSNGRFLRLLAVPLVILSVPMVPLFFFLDAVYGSAPLTVGRPAVVTVGINQPLERFGMAPELRAPDGIAVDSPAVRVARERQVSWRIRPERPVQGALRIAIGGEQAAKSVAAGAGAPYVSRKRTRSLVELVRYPVEMPLGAGPVEWIEIEYPAAEVAAFGMAAHWVAWFLAFSLVGAVLAPE